MTMWPPALRRTLTLLLVGASLLAGSGAAPATVEDRTRPAAGEVAPKVAAYLSYTAAAQGKASFRQHAADIDAVFASWWRPSDAADGTLALQEDGVTMEDTDFVAEARDAGAEVWGVVANYYGKGVWRWDDVSTIINDPERRAAHVRALSRLAVRKGYSGIDVDYEHGTRALDRRPFTRFVRQLARALHERGKKLSVTVQPKLSEPGNQPRHRIQNWKAIGAAADELHIMVYDYWPDNGQASQSPLGWWRQIASFAVSQVPGRKVMLGGATYGYHWAGRDEPVEDLEWRSIEQLRVQEGATATIDPDTGSTHYAFTDSGTRHHVWYEDADAMVSRAETVADFGLKGIFFWRLGGEDPRMWTRVQSALRR